MSLLLYLGNVVISRPPKIYKSLLITVFVYPNVIYLIISLDFPQSTLVKDIIYINIKYKRILNTVRHLNVYHYNIHL